MNKKHTLGRILILMSLWAIISCEKEFLDEPKPTEDVSSTIIFESVGGVNAFISGILRRFRTQYNRTDTGGVYSMYFARTLKGNDFIQRPTWYTFDYDNDNREPSYRRTNFTWNYCYDLINQSNILIQGITNSSSLSDSDKQILNAQARTLRAFFYFQLSMEFQHTYTYDPSLPSLPLYTEPSEKGKPMSTLTQIYDLILEDLRYATSNGSDSRQSKSYIHLNIMNGILARVYLVMGNWEGALETSRNAQDGYTLNAGQYGDGFNDISNDEWIWGMPQSSDQSNYYFLAPHAFTDHNRDSYFGSFINEDFVGLFSDTDVRKLFENKYGLSDYRKFVTHKFSFSFESDAPLMRISEMLLIEAECLARLGNDSEAQNVLFRLQSNRDPQATASGNSGNPLLEEILVERRKELYGELGIEWFDAKRLRRGITRTGNHRIFKNLEPDDNRFFLKIPQAEIDANENIEESINSSR